MRIHRMCCHHFCGRLILVSSLLGSLPFAIRYTFNNSLLLQYLRMRAVSYSDGLAGKRGWESNCIGLAFNKTPFPIEMKKIWTLRCGKEQWMFVISSCLCRVCPFFVICTLSIMKLILGRWADCRICHHQFCLSSLLCIIIFEIFVSILSSEFSGSQECNLFPDRIFLPSNDSFYIYVLWDKRMRCTLRAVVHPDSNYPQLTFWTSDVFTAFISLS